MNRHGFATLPLILIALAVIAAVGGYFVFEKVTTPRCDPASCQDNERLYEAMTTWQTYEFLEWQLTFKYPPGWTVERDIYKTPAQVDSGSSGGTVGLILFSGIELAAGSVDFIEVGGRQTGCEAGFTQNYSRCITKPVVMWTLSNNQQILSIFDTIASTIVASRTDTSDWKTYRNEQYGFEVKYPNAWEVKDDSYSRNNQRYPLVHITGPDRLDFGDYENVPVHYLIQISIEPISQKITSVADFARAYVPGDQSIWNTRIPADVTKTTNDYIVGKGIIPTFKFISP